MDLLLGVVHCEEFVDDVVRVISKRYPQGIESLLLEIPSNWEEINANYEPFEYFFLELERYYREKGTRIIYGDLPLDSSNPRVWWQDMFDWILAHKRDKSIIKNIKEHNPQVVVLGKTHANYVKRRFPDVPYIAFDVKPHDKVDALMLKLLGKSYRPDEVIGLVHRLPREYYLRRYHIVE